MLYSTSARGGRIHFHSADWVQRWIGLQNLQLAHCLWMLDSAGKIRDALISFCRDNVLY